MRIALLCVVLELPALEDLDLRSLDISHVYINGTLVKKISTWEQSKGLHFGSLGSKLGFHWSQSDASLCLFRRGSVGIMMPIFIDDITITSSGAADIVVGS